MEMNIQALSEHKEYAQKVLVGIGEQFKDDSLKQSPLYKAFAEKCGDNQEPYEWMIPFLYAYEFGEHNLKEPPDEWSLAYQHLAHWLEGKDYFVITLQPDDKIFRSGLDEKRIVAPCGSYGRVQCIEKCIPYTEESKSISMEIARLVLEPRVPLASISRPVCPHCKKPQVPNVYGQAHYCESGYKEQWECYQQWIANTMNRNMVILELGVSFSLPNLIRLPFEKMAFYNQKAHLYRVHSVFPQLFEDLKGKGTSVPMNPVTFLSNL